MTKFYLVESGHDSGTDWCGTQARELDGVHTLHDAMIQAAEEIGDTWQSDGYRSISEAKILVVENVVDMAEWLDNVKAGRDKAAALRKEALIEQAERAEYERLRPKFEGKVTK